MARVLFFSPDVIGASMAGPGIRYWELANAIGRSHDVTLAAPNADPPPAPSCEVVSYATRRVEQIVAGHDVLVSQTVPPVLAWLARRHAVRVVLDLYDPALLEILEHNLERPLAEQQNIMRVHRHQLRLGLHLADSIICATEKQRDLWIGALMVSGRLHPELYRRDPTLKSLVAVVPFGLEDRDPLRTGPGLRESIGLAPDDFVILWGGGIWNWLDPLTLIRAVEQVVRRRDDVKLVFMGVRHPNRRVRVMSMTDRAQQLAVDLGLHGKAVHFSEGWVPYAERQNVLLDADVGASTHLDHLETRFAFRTRILDYFWAGLPIVCSRGDALADLVEQRGLGLTAACGDVDGLAAAILRLAEEPSLRERCRANLAGVRERYRWSAVASTLEELLASLLTHPPRRFQAEDAVVSLRAASALLRATVDERGPAVAARWVGRRAASVLRDLRRSDR